jgi:leucyl-tRNA synthetase
VSRIHRYFESEATPINDEQVKKIKIFIYNMGENIISFSFNKCVAEIYTLLNYLEKQRAFTGSTALGKEILTCLFPIIPSLVNEIIKTKFNMLSTDLKWPLVNATEIEEECINLPIQINGRFTTTYNVDKKYKEDELLKLVLEVAKIKEKVKDSPIKKIIHVKNKILNIII